MSNRTDCTTLDDAGILLDTNATTSTLMRTQSTTGTIASNMEASAQSCHKTAALPLKSILSTSNRAAIVTPTPATPLLISVSQVLRNQHHQRFASIHPPLRSYLSDLSTKVQSDLESLGITSSPSTKATATEEGSPTTSSSSSESRTQRDSSNSSMEPTSEIDYGYGYSTSIEVPIVDEEQRSVKRRRYQRRNSKTPQMLMDMMFTLGTPEKYSSTPADSNFNNNTFDCSRPATFADIPFHYVLPASFPSSLREHSNAIPTSTTTTTRNIDVPTAPLSSSSSSSSNTRTQGCPLSLSDLFSAESSLDCGLAIAEELVMHLQKRRKNSIVHTSSPSRLKVKAPTSSSL